MANIFDIIRKETEKGNTFLNQSGDFVKPENIEKVLKKEYLNGLKDGSISFEKTYEDYRNDETEKRFFPVEAVEKVIHHLFVKYPEKSENMTEMSDSEPVEKVDE